MENYDSITEVSKADQAQIAQLVEQRTENPRVAGSIPALGTDEIQVCTLGTYLFLYASRQRRKRRRRSLRRFLYFKISARSSCGVLTGWMSNFSTR